MDNFTHSLTGWALGQAGLKCRTRKGLAALVLGANAPDLDVVTAGAGWVPLATHRGFTHSFIGGVLIMPLLVAGLLYAIDRIEVRRGKRFSSGLAMDARWLVALAALGVLTHPLLDLLTSYSVQLWTPLSRGWWRAEALFIIDPVLWVVLPLGIALSRRREAAGRPVRAWARPAIAALAFACVYIAANLALTVAARGAVRAAHPGARDIVASPPPGRPWLRTMAWAEDRRAGERRVRGYRAGDWSPAGGLRVLPGWTAAGTDDPDLRRALTRDEAAGLRTYLRWSVMPVARVRRQGCVADISLSDARYPDARARLSAQARIPLC